MGEPVYDVRLLSETGSLMRSSIGVSVVSKNVTAPLTTKTIMAVITTGKTNLALSSMCPSKPLH
jgi:hypothetical protein